MVITVLRSPFRQRQGERANTTNLDCVLWHALAIGPVCGMQCTWTAVPAKPRSSHCTGKPLGLVGPLARGRSLSDQINSNMSTDITGHYAPAHTIAVCHVGGCLPIGHASGLLEMWRSAGSLLQEFSVPFEWTASHSAPAWSRCGEAARIGWCINMDDCFSAMLAPSLVGYAFPWERAINYCLHVLIWTGGPRNT